ncbi:hypothetical protein FB45DRAFT_470160 [Roridomyces roridus]|uniref:F-box domain-containing protein n=1 Tax=Roridomyces roridus TaxID=1738132 RepID=A0AAD7FNJ0_9AGAR|nr:hypothetical protein FB45DRAFT_470160 [Roridomyces roridus]
MDSPLAAKLGTNYCPTAEEAVEIQAFLAQPLRQMKCLDSKIADLQHALNKLLEEREGLGSIVQSHEALLSPIRRMPADIMHEIFLACLPTHRNCVMDASEAPLLLGRVCSAWRTLLLTTPRLWASLHIVDRGEPPQQAESQPDSDIEYVPWPVAPQEPRAALVVDALRAWLERAGQCPLSLSLQYDPEFGYPPSQSIIQTIFLLASRWQHIHFAATGPVFQELVQLSAADVPELQNATLRSYEDGWESPGFAWNSLSFLAGPKVEAIAVSGADLDVSQLPLEWNRLTSLSNLAEVHMDWARPQSRTTVEAVLSTITRCTHALSLSFELANLQITGELDFVDHHLLQSLYLSGQASTTASLLDRIGLPQLKDFTLVIGEDPWSALNVTQPDSESSLVRFLATLPLLESLSLTAGVFSLSSVKEILLHLPPSLQHFYIHAPRSQWHHGGPESEEDFLAPLVTPGPTMPLPILRDFDVAIAGEEIITDNTLLQFITARGSTLKCVKISFERPMQFDIRDALSPLIENGLDFAATYSPVNVHKYSPWTGLPDAPKSV